MGTENEVKSPVVQMNALKPERKKPEWSGDAAIVCMDCGTIRVIGKMRPFPPPKHPKSMQSVLWGYRGLIKELRHKKWTWDAIAEEFRREHKVELTRATIRNYFKRSGKRTRKAG